MSFSTIAQNVDTKAAPSSNFSQNRYSYTPTSPSITPPPSHTYYPTSPSYNPTSPSNNTTFSSSSSTLPIHLLLPSSPPPLQPPSPPNSPPPSSSFSRKRQRFFDTLSNNLFSITDDIEHQLISRDLKINYYQNKYRKTLKKLKTLQSQLDQLTNTITISDSESDFE
jgi:hypothetical protein